MQIGDIMSGDNEVDGIAYIGTLNDYQATGIVNVLSGKNAEGEAVNATGALPDTYAYDWSSLPAYQNMGGSEYANAGIAASAGTDPRYPGVNIANGTGSAFGGGTSSSSYAGSYYYVEAEGIYVGYAYYESRYYDSVANTSSGAKGTAGSTSGGAWDYNKEVVYSFGHGLSYLDYEQKVTNVEVTKGPNSDGTVTATVEVTNKSKTDGLFLAQLYVQQPYTEYDKTNLVEKSAIMFLNSKKVNVEAGKTATVQITVPTKDLASYDYTNAKTYILEEGDYYFTAAAGSHEAVNNVLTAQGYTTAQGMDAAGKGAVVTWHHGETDTNNFSVSNGKVVTNELDNADLNYWLPGTVTYLTRQNWNGTFPKNYNENPISIGGSKQEEWIKEIQGRQYTINNTGAEAENVDGKDLGLRLNAQQVGYDQLSNIDDEYWSKLVSQISVDESIGAVIHGGGQTDALGYKKSDTDSSTNIAYLDMGTDGENALNPAVGQHEGVDGFSSTLTADGITFEVNIHSQTLIASSFNPDLAYEWGLIEGESGLRLGQYTLWGTGLTLRRTPYNGRNYEYISEDPMLTNRIGYGIIKGCLDMGILNGPKHIGFNDQEYQRAGIACYINEQKARQTDLRGFEGGLNDAGGLAVMVAFNRLGATNASHSVGFLQNIVRGEWGFKGIISTDLASRPYFNAESMIMAGITEVAEFGSNNSHIQSWSKGTFLDYDSNWNYISIATVKNDATLVNQARQNLIYQFYAFANSAVLNVSTREVTPWWETAIKAVQYVSIGLLAASAVALVAFTITSAAKEEEEKKLKITWEEI
jgi:beta-glucosidase